MNDVLDIKYDLVNRPERVYVDKLISKKSALLLALGLFIIGLIISVFVNIYYFLVILMDVVVLVVYNFYNKKMLLLKPLLASALMVSVYPLSFALTEGGIASPRRDSLFLYPIWLFLTCVPYAILQDVRDVKGDIEGGSKSYVDIMGRKKVRTIAVVSAILGIPFCTLPYILGMCGSVYLSGIILAVTSLLAGIIIGSDKAFMRGVKINIIIIMLFSLLDLMAVK